MPIVDPVAIIDHSHAGHQPIQNASVELCIVFTYEVDNFADLRREYVADYVG